MVTVINILITGILYADIHRKVLYLLLQFEHFQMYNVY